MLTSILYKMLVERYKAKKDHYWDACYECYKTLINDTFPIPFSNCNKKFENMEGQSYVSCIKINGVSILPPMITKDMKAEISNYKERAITVERKLAALHTAGKCNAGIDMAKAKEMSNNVHYETEIYGLKKNLDVFQYNNGNNYIESTTDAMDTNDVSVEAFEYSDENVEKTLSCSNNFKVEHKFEDQRNLLPATVSRTEFAITNSDTDCYEKEVSWMTSSTAETVSKIWKPQVPKTLNIIPLTLTNTDCRENKENIKNIENKDYQTGDVGNAESTPKLVRQGSYVLDTPSPILLAHMQMELASSAHTPCSEYVPTSNKVRRKEWNVTGSKVEWEYETESKKSISMESSKSLPMLKANSCSNNDRNMCKSISLQTKLEYPLGMFPSARSADCIRAMLAKEQREGNNIEIVRDKNCIIDTSDEKVQGNETWKRCNSSSILNGSGSLVDVNEHNNVSIGHSLLEKVSRNFKTQDSTSKTKSSAPASDKLLTVYKRVQDMHKKQMAELMSRQYREQTLLQKEFEKQQLLLLTEIRKSFPEFSVASLSENVLSPSIKNFTPAAHNGVDNDDNTQQNIGISETRTQCNNMKVSPCPLDYIYNEMNCNCVPCPNTVNSTGSEVEVDKEDAKTQLDVSRHYEEKLLESVECKHSNVSRELFPLDGKTMHVPILDRTMYKVKHIKAANIINAYVRGYLVRRMMNTERVIALKNTYKEALHCMLKLHVDAPLNRSEFNFLHRLQLQCDAASMNIVELFAQNSQKRMQVIAQDREIKQSRIERPTSARSYSFATQRTLARKKLKELEECQATSFVRSCLSRSRCQTWTSDVKETLISSNILYHGIKRSTSAGTVRKPWR